MAEKRDILFRFLGDSKSLNRATSSGQKGLGKMSTAMGGMGKVAGALGVTMGAGALVAGIGNAIGKAEEMDSQYAITEQILETTGNAAGVTAEHVKEAATEMALTTGIPKGVALEAQNVLLTFTNLGNTVGDTNDHFDRATALTADMATVFGGSAKDAAKQLGKALNDPIAGIGALSRVGVQFTEDQKEVIKSLVETGDVAGAQKIILEELEMQVGGTAEASADSSAKMARGWDEVSEALGRELLPVLDDLVVVVQDLTPLLVNLAGNAGGVAGELGTFAGAVDDLIGGGEGGLTGAANALGRLAWENTKFIPGLNLVDRALRENNIDLGVMAQDARFAASGVETLSYVVGQAPGPLNAAGDAIADMGDDAEGAEGKLWSLTDMVRIFRGDLFDLQGQIERTNVRRLFEGGGGSGQVEDPRPGEIRSDVRHSGGVIPGARGTNQLATVQAGERIMPLGSTGGGGANITINIGVAGDPYQTAQTIADLLTRYEQSQGTRISGVSL